MAYPNEPSNVERAFWASAGLQTFATVTGLDRSGDWEERPDICVGDFLCDLLHFCLIKGIDFEQCLKDGRGHFEEELREVANPGH